jgi:hypothetical protein
MKLLIALTLALAGMAAHAFDFSPAPNQSCGTYCTGYVTTDPAYTIDYVNYTYQGGGSAYPGYYRITVSVNGKVFQGSSTDGILYNSTFDSVTQTFTSDGTFVTISDYTTNSRRSCVRSGRGQHCTTWNWIVSGTVTP